MEGLDPEVHLDQGAAREIRAVKEPGDLKACLALRVNQAHLGHLDQLDLQVQRDHQDLKVRHSW